MANVTDKQSPPSPPRLTEPQQQTEAHQDQGPQQGHQEPDGRVPAPALALHHTLASHGCPTDHPRLQHTRYTHTLSGNNRRLLLPWFRVTSFWYWIVSPIRACSCCYRAVVHIDGCLGSGSVCRSERNHFMGSCDGWSLEQVSFERDQILDFL